MPFKLNNLLYIVLSRTLRKSCRLIDSLEDGDFQFMFFTMIDFGGAPCDTRSSS
jgi:hypothetical protein